jgi:hypothetical protein
LLELGAGSDEAEAVELLEKNAALEYDCGDVLKLLMEAVMLCDRRFGRLAKGKVCEAWRRHCAQSRDTSRRAVAAEAGERMVVQI